MVLTAYQIAELAKQTADWCNGSSVDVSHNPKTGRISVVGGGIENAILIPAIPSAF